MMKKLLLADDSITIQKVVGIIFATEDFELTMTDDGNSAFEKAQELLPDLVIADISMPGMDGFELCRAIKSDPNLGHTSVLLLPGAFDHFDEAKAQEVCADGWLTKPFESQALLDKVSQLVEAEPVRMAGTNAPEAEEAVPESEDETAAYADDRVDETVLGLEDVDALEAGVEDVEESPDDIWDAVSFEEDDLQSAEEEADSSLEDAFTAAGDVDGTIVEETTEETSEETTEAKEYSVAGDEGARVDENQEPVLAARPEVAEDSEIDSLAEGDLTQVAQEESADVDFSTFSDDEPEGKDSSEPEAFQEEKLESEVPVYDLQDEEPLELSEELAVDDFEETDNEPAISPVHEDAAVDEPAETEPVAVESDIAIEEETAFVDNSPSFEETVADQVETTTEPYSFKADEAADEDLDAQASDMAAEDDVLDLDEGEIIEDNAADETLNVIEENVDFSSEQAMEAEDTESAEVMDSNDEFSEADENFEFSDAESVDVESDVTDGFTVDSEQVDVQPDEAEDEGFYFDEAEEDDVSTVDVATATVTGAAMGATAAGAFDSEEPAVTSVDQVEHQLRHLSEDELKVIVSKVAGPMIEKMAGEMLEQIAWEVVPDLAEALIKEEIRKIKEAVSN